MKKVLSIIIAMFIMLGATGCEQINTTNVNREYQPVVTEETTQAPTENVILEITPAPTPEVKYTDMRIHFIDVGQGDSTFIELGNGQTMIIDAGNPNNASQIISYIKELGYSYIDYVVATHPHSDHIGGMQAVIRTFDIGDMYMP